MESPPQKAPECLEYEGVSQWIVAPRTVQYGSGKHRTTSRLEPLPQEAPEYLSIRSTNENLKISHSGNRTHDLGPREMGGIH